MSVQHFRRLAAPIALALAALVWAGTAVAQEATPEPGGTMIFAIGGDPQTLNPALTTNVEALSVSCKMFNGLVWIDRDLNVHPDLAESWEISEDGLRYEFQLREGVRWHDGEPFTAEDVVYTFTEVLANYHPRTQTAFENVSSVMAPDDHTVVVEFSEPYAPFLTQMTCQDGAIVPRHVFEGTEPPTNPASFESPVGTGPFVFSQWIRGDRVVMERNDDYFREGQPYLDEVIARVMPDPTSRVFGLLSGEVDYVQSYFLPKEEVARLQEDPAVQTQQDTDLPGNYLMFLNVENEPLDEAGVRQALLMGINRQQIVDQAFFGIGAPGESAVHRALGWASNPDVSYSEMYPYDPEAAGERLDELGYPRGDDGTRFSIRLIYNPAQAGFNSTAQIIQDNWEGIGVDLTLEPFENQVVTERVFDQREFDTFIIGYTTAGDVAVGVSRQYVTIEPGHSFTNPTNYSNPEVDRLFAEGASTPFVEERQEAYYEVQEILAEDLPVYNLVDRTEIDAAAAELVGLWESSQPYDRWDRVGWSSAR